MGGMAHHLKFKTILKTPSLGSRPWELCPPLEPHSYASSKAVIIEPWKLLSKNVGNTNIYVKK